MLQIFWRIEGPFDEVADLQPRNGSLLVGDEERSGTIVVNILPDTVPELDEHFKLVITGVEGGAETDPRFNVSNFRIRYV